MPTLTRPAQRTALRPTVRPQPDRVTQVNGFTVYEYNVPTPAQWAKTWRQVGPLVAMLLVADERRQAQETK